MATMIVHVCDWCLTEGAGEVPGRTRPVSVDGQSAEPDLCPFHESALAEAVGAVKAILAKLSAPPPRSDAELVPCRVPGCGKSYAPGLAIANHGRRAHPEYCLPCEYPGCGARPFDPDVHGLASHRGWYRRRQQEALSA